jgi:hypothetical protein
MLCVIYLLLEARAARQITVGQGQCLSERSSSSIHPLEKKAHGPLVMPQFRSPPWIHFSVVGFSPIFPTRWCPQQQQQLLCEQSA